MISELLPVCILKKYTLLQKIQVQNLWNRFQKILAQYVEAQHCPYEMIEDRGEAIRKAIMTSEGKSIL